MTHLFRYTPEQSIGEVRGVDTSQVFIRVTSAEKLSFARVGRLVAVQGMDANEWLIGMVNRVWRDPIETSGTESPEDAPLEQNAVQVTLVGTFRAIHGDQANYFTRAILSLPDINRSVYPIEDKVLEDFMGIISSASQKKSKVPLNIGTYTLDRKAKAFLDADKLFQRHAALFGSTGSGKSWAVATLLEQASQLEYANIILFDLHGEYNELPYARQLRIAGPGDVESKNEDVLFLPFWLLNYEESQALMVDHSEGSAPNQAMAIYEAIVTGKKSFLEANGKKELENNFTVDSPIPYSLEGLTSFLEDKNTESIDTGEVYQSGNNKGQPKTKQGPLHDKLARMLIRLKNKTTDLRYGFLFQAPDKWHQYGSLYSIAKTILGVKGVDDYSKPGIKVIDFSEVPSDVLPVMVSLVARLVFQIQFWMDPPKGDNQRHPVLLICDEAHLYLPSSVDKADALEKRAIDNFERIAKEGRKYGVGLLVVSQRPADVSTTVLSQCNNLISLRLSNERDKAVVRNLLPESLHGLLEVLPGLEIGEAVVIGDAILLPTRIVLNKPTHRPKSSTIDFWQRWENKESAIDLVQAVENFRKQSRKKVDPGTGQFKSTPKTK